MSQDGLESPKSSAALSSNPVALRAQGNQSSGLSSEYFPPRTDGLHKALDTAHANAYRGKCSPLHTEHYNAHEISIVEVLRYMKRSFEDDTLLDSLPLAVAGNPGAWHAWQAYRKSNTFERQEAAPEVEFPPTVLPYHRIGGRIGEMPDTAKQPGDWNWNGVWAERVRKGVVASVSDAVLFRNMESDELVYRATLPFDMC